MDKFIELLKLKNWYEHIIWKEQSDLWYMFWLDDIAYREERILGKKFWFIQRLIENDKIDTRKIDEDRLETIQYSEKERITIYDWLLMLLAIKNNPIEFLISVLK